MNLTNLGGKKKMEENKNVEVISFESEGNTNPIISYESKDFESYYENFLRMMIKQNTGYIDPDCEEDIQKTPFYIDLTDFLNAQEKSFTEEKQYHYFPPQKCFLDKLGNYENYKNYKNRINDYNKKFEELVKNGAPDFRDDDKISVWCCEAGKPKPLFLLTSDQFGFSANEEIFTKNINAKSYYPLVELLKNAEESERDKTIKFISEYVKSTRSIGGSFVWPVNMTWNENKWEGKRTSYVNQRRGVNSFVEDRVDKTLWLIKEFYSCYNSSKEMERDAVIEAYNKHHSILLAEKTDKSQVYKVYDWLAHFGTFETYVEYFKFDDFVDKNNEYRIYDITKDLSEDIDDKYLNEDKNEMTERTINNFIEKKDKKALKKMLINIRSRTLERSKKMQQVLSKKENTNISQS